MENGENSLSFFTANHSKHNSQWRMNGNNISVVCVACLVELLESPEVLNLKKRKVLGEIVFLLTNNQNLLELLAQNAKISSHLSVILMDLLSVENELLVNMAIEALDFMILKLRSEMLVEEIVDKLQGKILQLNNLKKSYPFVLTLGRLLRSIPALSLAIAKDSQRLVEYLLSNILYPEDNIKAAFLFVLLQICSSEDALTTLNFQTVEEICQQTCAVLGCGMNSCVQTNALGILRILSTHSDVLASVLKPSNRGTCAILESLKKLMLSSTDAIQIGAIQCVTQILRNDQEDNAYTKAFLTSGIGEMLLADLESSNAIVLGSVFCSLDYIVQTQAFYGGGYSVYGIESVIIGIDRAIKLKSPEVNRQGLRVLSLILSMQPSRVQLFPSEELWKKCANALLESFTSPDHRVLIQAACAVEHFLNIHHHPSSVKLTVIVPIVSAIISQLQKFTKPRVHFRNVSKASLETFLCSLLKAIAKTFKFVEELQAREPTYDTLLTSSDDSVTTENDALDQLVESLWKSIDQVCVPAVVLNYESVEMPDVFVIFFQILHRSVSSKNPYYERFAHKLASGSFARLSLAISEKFHRTAENTELTETITSFLAVLCLACVDDATDRIQLKDCLKKENIGCIQSTSVGLNLLAQSSVKQDTGEINDKSLFCTQCCFIELLYVSFNHGDEIVSAEELVMSLHRFFLLHSNLGILHRVSLKHLLFLCITCYDKLRSKPLASNTTQSVNATLKILEEHLMKFTPGELEEIYIHNVLFVSWVVSCESLREKFGRQILICFMRRGEGENSLPFKAFCEVLRSSPPSLPSLISLVESSEENIVNTVVKILEALIPEVSNSESDYSLNADRPWLSVLANHMSNIFHQLFLGNKINPLQDHSIAAMLKIMTTVQMNYIEAFDIKLVYHVITLLTSSNGCQRFTIPAINYLNVSLSREFDMKIHRVADVLLSNKALCEFIQQILDAMQAKDVQKLASSSQLYASVLVLISCLATSQIKVPNDDNKPFKVSKPCLITLANERESILGLTSLVFWDVYFRTCSDKPTLELFDMVQGRYEPVKMLDVDLEVLHVYLQNSMVHESESLRQCAVKCLGSFLCYVPNPGSFVGSPWTRIVLESHMSVLSVDIMTFSFVLFCSLILKHAPTTHVFTKMLQNITQSILVRIPDIPCSEQALSWHCVNLLAQLLSSEHNTMSQSQRDRIVIWLKSFKESFSACRTLDAKPKDDSFKFYALDGVIIVKDLLKPNTYEDLELLERTILLESNEVDRGYEGTKS